MPIGLLAVQAANTALEEAGLAASDIDGLANFPYAGHTTAGTVDGLDFVGTSFMANTLPARNLRWRGSVQPGDFISSVVAGIQAIASRTCDTVLVWRAMHNPRNTVYGQVAAEAAGGEYEFTAPYGAGDALSRFAMPYSRYMAKYGAQREHMAAFITTNRFNAAMNPDAVFYQRPITTDDYLSSRMIVEPFSILDCDMPVDGAGAIVLTSEQLGRSAKHPPVHIAAHASLGINYGSEAAILLEDHEDGAAQAAAALWSTTTLTPKDLDSANLYDGFSYFTYLYLEAFGLCAKGQAHHFIQDGRVALGGAFPLNTSGGSLGMGRLHGPPQVIESVRQLQRRCGDRQVHEPEAILAVTGQPHYSIGALVMTANVPERRAA